MKKQYVPIKKKLDAKLFMILLLYTIVGFVAIMLLQFVFLQFKMPLIEWLYWRLDMIYFFYLIIGLTVLFYHYWQKPWQYLNEVLSAMQYIYEQNSHTIQLSEPLRKVEQQMNQIKMSILLSQQAVKDAEDKKNEIIMYLAHDIRIPLTTVIGYLSLLNEATDISSEQKAKYIEISLNKAERLEILINELFEMTRYNTSSVQLKKREVDIYALLAQVIEEFYPTLSKRGNTTEISVEDNLIIKGDPEKLARVFNNLLRNATAYSYPNTVIDISAKQVGQTVKIVFQNHGQTISDAQLATIFEKFNRLDDSKWLDAGGVGLGLSIAKEIINLHGGHIIAQSSDETVTFMITLPITT